MSTWALVVRETLRSDKSRRVRRWPRVIRRLLSAVIHRRDLAPLLQLPPGSLVDRTVKSRPEILLFYVAPYINCRWDASERIRRVRNHFDTLERLGPTFAFDVTESVELLHLDMIDPAYTLVLDRPRWFTREGVLALNIFKCNIRLFSLAFAFEDTPAGLTMIIGGIQGRNLPEALEEYRFLTKAFHGVRPRDLCIEFARMLAAEVCASRILAVSDACRHHRSVFFGRNVLRRLPLNYDEVWQERGGELVEGGFFELPLKRPIRSPSEIPARKRAMYRDRYALLELLAGRLAEALPHLTPVSRPEAD